MTTLLNGLLYMKVGYHAYESFEEILLRKSKELDEAGFSFWGYGGNTCHPLRVQSFAAGFLRNNRTLELAMELIRSNANPDIPDASSYSINGIDWLDLPDGIQVTGSRYALVLGEIRPCDFEVNMADYEIGIGPSAGKAADEYVKGRVDKAILSARTENGSRQSAFRRITQSAELKPPFAVFVR